MNLPSEFCTSSPFVTSSVFREQDAFLISLVQQGKILDEIDGIKFVSVTHKKLENFAFKMYG